MNNVYVFSEIIKNVYSYIATKIFYGQARLIRRPFYIRGKSSLEMRAGLTTGYGCRFDLPGNNQRTLFLGENIRFGERVHIVASKKVTIDDDCLFASNIFVSDTNHGEYGYDSSCDWNIAPKDRELIAGEVKIGKKCWVGENVCILKGVSIGDGCIIGANSIVNKNVDSYSIACGIPAKVIKKYNFEKDCWEKV